MNNQIEEMARDIYMNTSLSVVEIAENIAEYLCSNGYRKTSDVAREVIGEIERKIADEDNIFERCASRLVSSDYANGRSEEIGSILYFLTELKKKYTEGA